MTRTWKVFVALVLVFSLIGCSEIVTTQVGTQATRPTYVVVEPPAEDIPEEELFTVTLHLNGKPITEDAYFYQMFKDLAAKKDGIYAQWNDGYSYFVAKFDENGVAKAAGLDGTYHVTLSDVPGDYVYNVNDYYATNDERQIVVDVYRLLISSQGDGSDKYYPYIMEFGELGVYEITINSPDQVVYCRYTPDESGIYQIASWESVAEDKVNPKVDVYGGSVAYIYYRYTLDDGGAEADSGFCKNFSYTESLTDDEVGNIFAFGVRATSKDGIYPIKVKVAVLRIGDPDDGYLPVIMVPKEVIRRAPDHESPIWGKANFLYAWSKAPDGSPLLDETPFKLWKAEDGGDGFYHFYDEEKYASTGGWGPTLYAQITTVSEAYAASLSNVEWEGQGNSYLSLQTGNKIYRYKQFIEGFESLAREHGGIFVGSNYCSANCFCHSSDPANPTSCPSLVTACLEGCENCDKECTPCPPELYGVPGYADGVNSHGCYPVTQELKEFLQLFAQCHALFSDGMGTSEEKGINSDEDSMWLWAVGYFDDDKGGFCEMGDAIPNYYD